MSAKEMSKADIAQSLMCKVYRMSELLKAKPEEVDLHQRSASIESLLRAMNSLVKELEFTVRTVEDVVGTRTEHGLACEGYRIRLCDAVKAMARRVHEPIVLKVPKKVVAGVR